MLGFDVRLASSAEGVVGAAVGTALGATFAAGEADASEGAAVVQAPSVRGGGLAEGSAASRRSLAVRSPGVDACPELGHIMALEFALGRTSSRCC